MIPINKKESLEAANRIIADCASKFSISQEEAELASQVIKKACIAIDSKTGFSGICKIPEEVFGIVKFELGKKADFSNLINLGVESYIFHGESKLKSQISQKKKYVHIETSKENSSLIARFSSEKNISFDDACGEFILNGMKYGIQTQRLKVTNAKVKNKDRKGSSHSGLEKK